MGCGCVNDGAPDIPVDLGRLFEHTLGLGIFGLVTEGLESLSALPQGARLLPEDIRAERIGGRSLVASEGSVDLVEVDAARRRASVAMSCAKV